MAVFLDADFALQVASLDGKRHFLAFFHPAFLVRCSGADGGIEGDVAGLSVGRARLDIASAFAFGVGARSAAGIFSGKFIERGVQSAGDKGLACADLLPAVPPVGIVGREHILPGWVRRALRLVRAFFRLFRLGPTFFFSGIFGRWPFFRRALGGLPDQLLDPFLKLFGIHFRLVEGTALDAVRKGQFCGQGDVVIGDGRAPVEGGLGAGGFQDDQVSAVTVHVQRGGQRSDGKQVAAGVIDLSNQFSSPVRSGARDPVPWAAIPRGRLPGRSRRRCCAP